jgi:hypothetical protein
MLWSTPSAVSPLIESVDGFVGLSTDNMGRWAAQRSPGWQRNNRSTAPGPDFTLGSTVSPLSAGLLGASRALSVDSARQ